jgi:hypothetical protein
LRQNVWGTLIWTLSFALPGFAAEELPKWDVAETFGPTTPLDFETDEGTWINLDVSPDGKRIVFDILGDLYLMPVEGTGGGLAERLTSARRHAARFSPSYL